MRVRSGRDLIDGKFGAYDLIPKLSPGLMLDLGAAAGTITRRMLSLRPEGRVIAFEPFPGNWPHFQDRVGDDPRVTLIKGAVSDKPGKANFHVKQTVQPNAAGRWAAMPGYSSVGQLEEVVAAPPGAQLFEVDVVTIDDIVGDETVEFCKIDVQGAEKQVLEGAAKTLADGRMNVLLVEYSGELDLGILDGFDLFDQEYMLIPRNRGDADMSAWDIGEERIISTGRMSKRGWPKKLPKHDYADWYNEEARKIGRVWTDILAIRRDLTPSLLPDFERDR